MRADRLLTILMLLQVSRSLATREIAGQLEVSERTVHRDMEALSAMGVPVVADRGVKGGWRLLTDYRSDLTGLNENELAALFVPASERLLKDLGLSSTARSALTKLLASLPEARRRQADRVRDRLLVDASGWRQSPEGVPLFQVLQEAVFQDRRLAMRYERGDGEIVERRVEPLGLVAKGSTWYMVAACEGELRTYRAARIQAAELLPEAFTRPEGFDLSTFWAASSREFVTNLPEFRLVGRVAPDLQPRLKWVGRFSRVEQVDPPGPDGWSRVTVRVQTAEEAREYALGLGTRFEVLEPASLREAVLIEARGVLQAYERSASPLS